MQKIFSSYKNSNLSMAKFIIYFTLFNILAYNLPVYKYAISKLEFLSTHFTLTLFSITIALFTISAFIFLLFASALPKFITKGFFILIVISNSIALYFVNTYNVILDKSMMGNVFNTNTSEAFSYYDINLILYIIFLGIIPSFIIYKIKLEKAKRLKLLALAITILVSAVGILYINSNTWLWFDKNAKVLGGLTMPWSYSINAIRYQKKKMKQNEKRVLLPNATFLNQDEKLVVLIIGESARSANFSLYGYNKQTNPNLIKQNIQVLKNTKSSTTYTTASIHSMLSYLGSTSDNFEVLPNYLQRQGVDVLWRANNWGQPKLKLSNYENSGDLRNSCKGIACDFDEVLLTNLKEKISQLKTKKKFVVLHTVGSHGPTYFKKYPKEFEIFKPVCKSVDVSSCTQEELINAYDNTIVYTDYFISQTINTLKQLDIPTMMIYISDHGESLGEYGLYLHGTPYSIAPDFQKDIPFLIWKSKDFHRNIKLQNSYAQNNIFHTVLSALDIRSEVYNKNLDLLK